MGVLYEKKEPREEMYEWLVAYKKTHNHINIPQLCEEDPRLGYWVGHQRKAYMKKTMTEKRKRLLDSIEFEWGSLTKHNKALWEEMYKWLVAYKEEHKHTYVPLRYKEDFHLGNWAGTQCKVYRKKTMTEKRKYLLNFIGFEWNMHSLWIPSAFTTNWRSHLMHMQFTSLNAWRGSATPWALLIS